MDIEIQIADGTTRRFRVAQAQVDRAVLRAGSDAIKAMRAESNRKIRQRKAIKVRELSGLMTISGSNRKSLERSWTLRVKSALAPVSAFPHRQVGQRAGRDAKGKFTEARKYRGGTGGVAVTINKGERAIIRNAFVATMGSKHEGVFKRVGKGRLPIREVFTTRMVGVFKSEGFIPAVQDRARAVFRSTLLRNLNLNPDGTIRPASGGVRITDNPDGSRDISYG